MVAKRHLKIEVDYSKGKMETHCSNCRHWIPGGKCEIVVGEIRPDYWCRLWAKKQD